MSQRTFGRAIRIALIAVLGAACWLSRISLPHDSVTLELDPTYQQALGHALASGLRFGRDIVFTTGPLGYFTSSPYEPDLYWAKFWLWEVLLGLAVALLLFARLLRRGTWLDAGVGVVLLIVLPKRLDEWLFVLGLLALDLGLEALEPAESGASRPARALRAGACLLLLSILPLMKVTSLTLALALVALLVARAASAGGLRSAVKWALGWLVAECLLWVAIGQRLQDLPAFFASSLELAGGFSSAMSMPAESRELVFGIVLLAVGLAVCAVHAFTARGERAGARIDAPRAQALGAAAALVLAYKSGFTRADHVATFFTSAAIVPLFLLPLRRAATPRAAWKGAALRCGAALATLVCLFTLRSEHIRSPGAIGPGLVARIEHAFIWVTRPGEIRANLEESRARLQRSYALPRVRAIVGDRGVCAFTTGHGLIFLNDLHWKPRPVFQAFGVFTQRTARANADFLASPEGPQFLLMRPNAIDRRLPSSEDPLSLQILLRDFRVRASEGGFLLLERAPPRELSARSTSASGSAAWGESLLLPPGDEPLVLRARVQPSLLGRLRSALYQAPAVNVETTLENGEKTEWRVAPFALEAGVVLRPFLPTNNTWIVHVFGQEIEKLASVRLLAASPSAFADRIEWELVRAPDLDTPRLETLNLRELKLGILCDAPLRFESELEPELDGWTPMPPMVFVRAPASFVYAAGPGTVHLTGLFSIPESILADPAFLGERVRVLAHEGGDPRECESLELGTLGGAVRATTVELNSDVELPAACELEVRIEPVAARDPEGLAIGVRKLRVLR